MNIDQRKDLVKSCPRKVFGYNEVKQSVEIERADDCNLCEECIRYCKNQYKADKKQFDKDITIGEDEDKYIFIVESTGALQPLDIVRRAFRILKEKIDKFSTDLTS